MIARLNLLARYWRPLPLLLALLGLAACATPPPPPLPTYAPPPVAAAPRLPPQAPGAPLFVAVPRLNLRACPATNCQIIRVLSRNTELAALGEQGGWVQVRVLSNGLVGWVGGRYVSPQPVSRSPRLQGPAAPSGQPAPAPESPSEEWAEPPQEAPGPSPEQGPASAPEQSPAPPAQGEPAPLPAQ